MNWLRFAALLGVSVILARPAESQTPLAWEAVKYFRYNIERASVDKAFSPYTVKVIFSLSDPTGTKGSIKDASNKVFWNIKTDPPFVAGATSRLGIDIGWDSVDFTNSGAANEQLLPLVPQGKGAGPALPLQINAFTLSAACTPTDCPGIDSAGRYFVTAFLPVQAVRTGRIALEGHPAWPVSVNGVTQLQGVPVKNVFKDFAITDSAPVTRRQIVAIEKCQKCHTGTPRKDGQVIPRLSLHGGNRTEEPGVCIVCHNGNQTDIPYRSYGNEESVNFPRMVHGIHAAERRLSPLIIIGRSGSVNDFSTVDFPGKLSNCVTCHIDINGTGTFELPLKSKLGTTVNTQSMFATPTSNGYVDVNPSNDLKITATAAVCSACHDKPEVLSHMVRKGGASFSTLQSAINSGTVKERCADCHGRGKDKDVRRVHEIGSR